MLANGLCFPSITKCGGNRLSNFAIVISLLSRKCLEFPTEICLRLAISHKIAIKESQPYHKLLDGTRPFELRKYVL